MIKKLRLAIQIGFFTVGLLAAAAYSVGDTVSEFYYALHLFPSLSQLAWLERPPLLLVTLAMLVIPLIVGRIYCSYICPVGFIQDLVHRLAKGFKTLPLKSAKPFSVLGLFVLVVCIAAVVFQTSFYSYFDHFSNFGRVVAAEHIGGSTSAAIAFVFIFIILILPLVWPRWFCTAVCPSGALYRLLSKRQLFAVRLAGKCSACGECETACPVLCIDHGRIDPNACISCFECLDSCPGNAFDLKYKRPRSKSLFRQDRRTLLQGGAYLFAGGFAGWSLSLLYKRNGKAFAVVPPGGKAVQTFFAKCHSCALCINACPTNVLKPGSVDLGLAGLTKPVMDYNNSYCSYECNACLAVCPSEALSYFPLEEKKQIRLGKAKLVEDLCIPYVQETDCGACAEVCPTGAVKMKPYKETSVPEINNDYCIGCGACQHSCPVDGERAIVVAPEDIHTIAYTPPGSDSGAPRVDTSSEFPF